MTESNDPHPSVNRHQDGSAGFPESRLEDDDMFDALAHHRRRYLLYTLLEDEVWSLEELARKLAAWENEEPVGEVDGAEVERVYASLYHAHVPKLVDLGIVSFDPRAETMTRGPNADQTLDALEHTGASISEELEKHARK